MRISNKMRIVALYNDNAVEISLSKQFKDFT